MEECDGKVVSSTERMNLDEVARRMKEALETWAEEDERRQEEE